MAQRERERECMCVCGRERERCITPVGYPVLVNEPNQSHTLSLFHIFGHLTLFLLD